MKRWRAMTQGLRIAPDDAELLNRRGVALLELGRPGDALESFERVLAADPDHLDALGNYGNALLKLNRPAEALAAYERALTTTPENAQLLTNRAVALRRLDRPHEALMSASRALVSRPDFAQARFVESVARLTLGDFGAGWRGYEARWSVGLLASQRRSFTAPLWLGRESARTARPSCCTPNRVSATPSNSCAMRGMVAARGAKTIIVEVQRELVRLLVGNDGHRRWWSRAGRLCRRSTVTVRCSVCRLRSQRSRRRSRRTFPTSPRAMTMCACGANGCRGDGRLIGLAWSGARAHDNDLNRSLRLETFSPLLRPAGCHVRQSSARRCVRRMRFFCAAVADVSQIGGEFRDFADTAAVLACLDAVISVDTAVAHLAGAMGKPLLLLAALCRGFPLAARAAG